MENIILSLLLIKSMTIYEMKVFIEKFLSSACSNSLGSMQVAIKKLLAKEKIEFSEYEENGRKKKEYRITEKGVQHFLKWMSSPFDWNKGKNIEESKFFFLGMMPKNDRIKMLKQLIEDKENEKKELMAIQELVESKKETMVETNVARIMQDEALVKNLLTVSNESTLEQAVQNIGNYQFYMLEYGLKRNENDLNFFRLIYEREMRNEGE